MKCGVMREIIEHTKAEIRKVQRSKYISWKTEQHKHNPRRTDEPKYEPKPKFLDNFVVNLPSVVLKDEEIELLNKGLKFVVQPKTVPVEDLCVVVMSSVRYMNAAVQDDIINTLNIMRQDKEIHTPNETAVSDLIFNKMNTDRVQQILRKKTFHKK